MLTDEPRRWGIAVVRGRSMLPTLHEGDRLLVRYNRLPATGDLAVVQFDGVTVIKRLTLHEGEEWWFSRDNPTEGVDSWSRGMPSATSEVLATAIARVWPWPKRL